MGQTQGTSALGAAGYNRLQHLFQGMPELQDLGKRCERYLQDCPPAQMAALQEYTGQLSRLLNAWLVGQDSSAPLTPAQIALLQTHTRNLFALVVLSPGLPSSFGESQVPIMVFTGFRSNGKSDPDFYRAAHDLQIGDPIGFLRNRFVSTSLDYSTALQFAKGAPCCIFRLRIVPGMAALPVWEHSRFPDELEVLLPPGYQWRVANKWERLGEPTLFDAVCTNAELYQSDAGMAAGHKALQQVLKDLSQLGVGARRVAEQIAPWTTADQLPEGSLSQWGFPHKPFPAPPR